MIKINKSMLMDKNVTVNKDMSIAGCTQEIRGLILNSEPPTELFIAFVFVEVKTRGEAIQ